MSASAQRGNIKSVLATLVLTILIFVTVLVVLMWVRTPRYRIQRHNVITLLELVLSGQASENDWRVFEALPLRHNPELDEIRNRCMEIEEREYIGPGRSGFLFSQQGLDELRELLQSLQEKEMEESSKDKDSR